MRLELQAMLYDRVSVRASEGVYPGTSTQNRLLLAETIRYFMVRMRSLNSFEFDLRENKEGKP